MSKRHVEVFSAGCAACQEAIELINNIACPSCEITVHDMDEPAVAARAKALGIRAIPAVLINGKLADCCSGGGVTQEGLGQAGVGQPIPRSGTTR